VSGRAAAGAMLLALAFASVRAQDPGTAAKPATPAKIDTSAKAVIAAAVEYVRAYQNDMAFVLADELATQTVTTPNGGLLDTRRTRAEFFLTYLPEEGQWISVRDVREVDGAAINEPDDIRSLIQRAPLGQLGSTIAKKNSRFNIGNIRRTFNEPTFGLLVLSDQHHRRFRFDRVGVSGGTRPVVTLKFTEHDRPTLVSGTTGEPVFSHGELDIDAATGCVERTRIELTLRSVRATLSTAYAPDGKLDLWVPAIMSERYENTAGALRQTITVDTEYTNYRRFDTRVIIK